MRRILLASLLAALPLLGGCISHTPIKGSDYTANTPLLRGSFPIGAPGPQQKRIQASVAHQEGQFQDGVESGKTASLDDTEFDGPTTLEGETQITTGHVGVVFPIPMGDQMRWEPTAGAGIINSRLTVSDATASATLDDERVGPSGGIAFIMTTADKHFGLRAAVDYTWAFSVSFLEHEVAAFYAPTPSVEFLIGYRQFDYMNADLGDSDIELTMSGPAAGINLRF